MIKGSIQEEGITNALNIETHKYIKQMLTDVKGEINSNTIIVGDFNTPLTSRDSFSRHKINKETLALNNTLNQMDLIGIDKELLCESSRVHILFKGTWNILQDRSPAKPQNKPQ